MGFHWGKLPLLPVLLWCPTKTLPAGQVFVGQTRRDAEAWGAHPPRVTPRSSVPCPGVPFLPWGWEWGA